MGSAFRRLAQAVVLRALLDVEGRGPFAENELPGRVRADALEFLRRAAAGGPESAWFELAGVSPSRALAWAEGRLARRLGGPRGRAGIPA